MPVNNVQLIPVDSFPEIRPGDNLPLIISNTIKEEGAKLNNNDIVVVAQKIVSKAEKRKGNTQIRQR